MEFKSLYEKLGTRIPSYRVRLLCDSKDIAFSLDQDIVYNNSDKDFSGLIDSINNQKEFSMTLSVNGTNTQYITKNNILIIQRLNLAGNTLINLDLERNKDFALIHISNINMCLNKCKEFNISKELQEFVHINQQLCGILNIQQSKLITLLDSENEQVIEFSESPEVQEPDE